MSDMKQLARKLRVLAKAVPENANVMVRTVALAIDQALILSTPVDTGRARGNWQVSIGAPLDGEVQGLNLLPSKHKGKKASALIEAATGGDTGTFAIKAALESTKDFKGGTIYIVNNLPYIVPLNEGHSKQAPEMFVQLAILNGIKAVQNATLISKPDGFGGSNG